jgi:hypothetical protein
MRYMGYRDAELTGSGPDGGLDDVADGAVAQVKFQAHTVGAPELQRLFGARVHATHRQLLFFTGTGYSPKAAAYAADAGIALFTYDPVGQAQPVNAAAAHGHHTREVGAVEMWNDYGTACPRPGCPAHAAGGPVEFEHADGTTTAVTGS